MKASMPKKSFPKIDRNKEHCLELLNLQKCDKFITITFAENILKYELAERINKARKLINERTNDERRKSFESYLFGLENKKILFKKAKQSAPCSSMEQYQDELLERFLKDLNNKCFELHSSKEVLSGVIVTEMQTTNRHFHVAIDTKDYKSKEDLFKIHVLNTIQGILGLKHEGVDVRPIPEQEGLMDYLTKQTRSYGEERLTPDKIMLFKGSDISKI